MSSFDFMKKMVIFVLLASIFSACNLYQNHALKQMKQLTSAGMTQYIEVLPNKNKKSVSVTNKIDPNKKNLLLIHGYQGSSYAQWSSNVDELSKHFNIVAPDLNYHGSTYFQSDYSVEMQADLVHNLIEYCSKSSGNFELTNQEFIVIGSSYGGLVGARFAEKYPESVSAYVSLDGLSGCFNKSFTDSVAQSHGISNAIALLNPTTGRQLRKLASLEKPVFVPNFILKQVAKEHFGVNREEKIELLEYLNNHEAELNNHIFQWKCPVYLVWGENDKIIPLSTAKCLKQKYQIPEDRVFVYPKTGHILNMQNPKAFNKWVIETFSN
jgi:pimeloyl-ACP methyl ester carboxylesterase